MKILIDPELSLLVEGLSDAECAEILRCILQYLKRDSDIPLWRYIKTKIDRDAQKYKEKCERIAACREKRLALKSKVIDIDKENENIKKIKDIDKDSDSSNAFSTVEKAVENFLITQQFSFDSLKQIRPAFGEYLNTFPKYVITRAERTLREKRVGQHMNAEQIMLWIEKENTFYKEKMRG